MLSCLGIETPGGGMLKGFEKKNKKPKKQNNKKKGFEEQLRDQCPKR